VTWADGPGYWNGWAFGPKTLEKSFTVLPEWGDISPSLPRKLALSNSLRSVYPKLINSQLKSERRLFDRHLIDVKFLDRI